MSRFRLTSLLTGFFAIPCIITAWLVFGADNVTLQKSALLFAAVFFLSSSLLWPIYGILMMYGLIKKADKIVSPELTEVIKIRGDDFFYRAHRLILYSMSASSQWMNGRVIPDYDFRNLSVELRLPLQVFFYWLLLDIALIATGYVASIVAK